MALKYKFVTPLTSMVVTKPEDTENANETEIADKPQEGTDIVMCIFLSIEKLNISQYDQASLFIKILKLTFCFSFCNPKPQLSRQKSWDKSRVGLRLLQKCCKTLLHHSWGKVRSVLAFVHQHGNVKTDELC